MSDPIYDVAIIGGGIVGLATALALVRQGVESLVVLEAEDRLARHQTGNNSGVIHSGLYYKPGSLKAQNCTRGRDLIYRFCAQNNVPYERCGKVVVAVDAGEVPRLDALEERGRANGLEVRRLTERELHETEPHARGVAALHVPETGIVDYVAVAQTMARLIAEKGAEIRLGARVLGVRRERDLLRLETAVGVCRSRYLINCGGLQCDRIARLCGFEPDVRIIPFRGEYYELRPESRHLVRNLIYPVPDPQFPFLGVHFTRMVNGHVEAGPNAVLAFKREGYRHRDIDLRDLVEIIRYAGFRRLAGQHWRMGFGEFYRSLNKRAFVKALQRLLPELKRSDLVRGGAGVRAQAIKPDGTLADDFHFAESEKMLHVLNAPSPAATASLSIGKTIAERIMPKLARRATKR